MTTIVEISDNEDADDCVIKSVVFVVDDEPESDLYLEVSKENKLLADLIQVCLNLENTEGMLKILKEDLLKHYYAADRTARESPRFQKNLRRANYLIKTDPRHKFTHIKDLCNILKAIRVKKKVPFVTLTTNLTDTGHKSNELIRSNIEQLHVNNDMSKKSKLNNDTPFSETMNSSFDVTCSTIDENINMETCSQESGAEGDRLLIPKKEVPIIATCMEKRLKVIEKKISYYKRAIAVLDELEVDDDNVNSPYIKSERLKAKIVSLYKERCQLIGSEPVNRKLIRLKLADGHPPGPTRCLERFLNKNCNKDGVPPFPDFCDVITCVTEANVKDDLGWSKAQIMNEASALFTLCGRALQKRRQNREYRDLMFKVKMEQIERDPADDDPELRAKLEENKRIAVKKESDILERYTMMQYLPPKSKSQKNITLIEDTENENSDKINGKDDEQQDLINDNDKECLVLSTDECEKSRDIAHFKIGDKNIITTFKSNSDLEMHKGQNLSHIDITDSSNNSRLKMYGNEEKTLLASTLLRNINTKKQYASEQCVDVRNGLNNNKMINACHIIKSVTKVKNIGYNRNIICNKNNDLEAAKVNFSKIQHLESIENQVKNNLDEDATGMFKSLGDNFTVTVEIMSDS